MALPGRVAASSVLGASDSAIQPAGVDVSVCEVLEYNEPGVLGIEARAVPRGRLLESRDGWWLLEPGAYKVRFCEVVRVPGDQVALCFPRSSLLRMGSDLRCTVWDPGYVGRGEGLLVVYNKRGLRIQRGARVAQLVFFKLLESPHRLYEGAYQGEGLDSRE